MTRPILAFLKHTLNSFRVALVGPQLLTFLPALVLLGYWFGWHVAAMFAAVILPTLLVMVGVFSPPPRSTQMTEAVDPITHLPLRTALEAALDRAFKHEGETGLRAAAMVLEVDDFSNAVKDVGPETQDNVLRVIASRLATALRQSDLIVRLDGSVFAVALSPSKQAGTDKLLVVGERLQAAVSEPITVDGLQMYLTASVGFCLPKRASEKSGSFCLDAAESALIEAQSVGRGAIRAFSTKPKRKRVVQAGLVSEVANALESGEIRPWYQPQLSTETGEVSGIEALARWMHPSKGVILPGAFLPAISAAGMTNRLGEIILFHALSTIRDTDEAGLQVPTVGVNFSSDDLSDPKLSDKIKWELDRFDLAPERLTVEILETVIARSSNDVITRNLAQLSEYGCGIDLDDFGTGHASIANIRRFSVNRIKIDRTFVSNIEHDRQQQQMLTAILEMANHLDIATLAEGVETSGEHTLLSRLGCQHVQGFHIGRPMPFDDMCAWLSRHSRNLEAYPEVAKKSRQ